MRIICRYCQAMLSREEYFWFYKSCMSCEVYRQTMADEQTLSVKSPLLAYYTTLFHVRRTRNALSAWLRNIGLV